MKGVFSVDIRQKQEAVSNLINEYVKVVDSRRVEDWPGLFAEEAAYSVVTRENYDRGLPIALILDDSRDRIEDRVIYITKVWAGHFNDYYPRHIVSNISISPFDVDDSQITVTANVAVYITELEGNTYLLAVGQYVDTVTFFGNVARFKEKKTILDTNVLPRYFVYPL
jgi:anthranilate 1,2-dioxygenase small subunit